jgi:hypothetical protein
MRAALILLFVSSGMAFGQSPTISCVGTPGNTTGVYQQQCNASTGATYVCGARSGCTVASDWGMSTALDFNTQVKNRTSGGVTYTAPGAGAVPRTVQGHLSDTPYVAADYAGSDLGAKINAAYAALPSTGGHIAVSKGTYSFSTPIVLGTAMKPAYLDCDPATTIMTYTGTGAAITLDWGWLDSNDQHEHGAGIIGCWLKGPGGTSVGVAMQGPNGGVIHPVLDRMKIWGFGKGINFSLDGGEPNTSFFATIRDTGIAYNTLGIEINTSIEAIHIITSDFYANSQDIHMFGTPMDVYAFGCSFDGLDGSLTNPFIEIDQGYFFDYGSHYENSGKKSAHFIENNGGIFVKVGVKLRRISVSGGITCSA